MKGIIFTEFLEMVEHQFSLQVVDTILSAAVPIGGSYTSVGNYDHRELLSIVGELGKVTGLPVSELVRAFGRHLFNHFTRQYPQFFARTHSTFDFLSGVENHVHTEVRKLYPDAELPSFGWEVLGPGRALMTYRSSRPFADLAHGLIESCIHHFQDGVALAREDLSVEQGYAARFILTQGR